MITKIILKTFILSTQLLLLINMWLEKMLRRFSLFCRTFKSELTKVNLSNELMKNLLCAKMSLAIKEFSMFCFVLLKCFITKQLLHAYSKKCSKQTIWIKKRKIRQTLNLSNQLNQWANQSSEKKPHLWWLKFLELSFRLLMNTKTTVN